ncbi:MAG: MFS transporter [Oscillospiraceae bacterium]|nr:MFS transporter [Oscillospiraceae bacterium]
MRENKLSFGVKAGYGMGMLGECLAMNTFYIFFIFFLTDAVGMDPGAAGMIAMIAVFWGAFTDLYAGIKTDGSRNPNGRRRPFIYRFAIPLGVAIFLMYTDWAMVDTGLKFVYFLLASMLFWLALSFTDIPYLSLGSEITDDYAERNSVRSYANILNYAGMILASSGTLFLVSLMSGGEGIGSTGAWSRVGLLFGVLVLLAYWLSAAATKGREPALPDAHAENSGFVKPFLEVAKIRPFRHILLYTVFAYGGVILFTSFYIYYLFHNMGFDDGQAALLMLVYCFMVMGVSAVLGFLKIERRTLVVALTVLLGVGMFIAHFTGLGTAGIYLVFFLFSMAISAYFVLIYAMVYDVCDIDEFLNNERREGVIVSLFYFVGKVIGGVAMAAVGWLLTLARYDAALLEQSGYTLAGISLGTMLIPGVLMVIGGLIILRYPVNSKNFAALRQAIDARSKGESYSTDAFKELL